MALVQLYLAGQRIVDSAAALPPQADFFGRRVSLISLTKTYAEPAELVLHLYGDVRNPPVTADQRALLLIDGRPVFEGLTQPPTAILAAGQSPGVEVRAFDRRMVMANPTAMTRPPEESTNSPQPRIELNPGALRSLVDALLAHVGPELVARGVADRVDYRGGADAVECEPVSLNYATIDEAFARIAASAPGVRVCINPDVSGITTTGGALPRYTFVNLFGSNVARINLDVQRAAELSIRQSLAGCAGAVRVMPGITVGETEAEFEEWNWLRPGWNAAKEENFRLGVGGQIAIRGGEFVGNVFDPDEPSNCYRLWSFAHFADRVPRGAALRLVSHQNGSGSLPNTGFDEDTPLRVTTGLRVDWENSLVLSDTPLIGGGLNPFDPGRHKRRAGVQPADFTLAALLYSRSGSGSANINILGQRHPPGTGFAGRAFQLAPTTCGYEAVVEVPPGVQREGYARQAHAVMSQPKYEGTVPIDEPSIDDGLLLDRRISFGLAAGGPIGWEQMDAPLMGVRLSFAGRIVGEYQFAYDAGELLRGRAG